MTSVIPGLERPHKRLFMALLSLSFLCMTFLAYAVWRVSYLGLLEINAYLPLVLGIFFASVVFLTGFGILSMVGAILGLPFLHIFQKQFP